MKAKHFESALVAIVILMLLLQADAAFAQRAVGNMIREGAPAKLIGPMTRSIKSKDGTEKHFEVLPYQGGYGDSPRGKNNERLPGLMFLQILPDGMPVWLASPENRQEVVLVATEPNWNPVFLTSSLTVKSAENPTSSIRTNNSVIKGAGFFATIVGGEEGGDVAGLPYSRLDITPLRDTKGELHFFGKRWRPKDSGQSLILVDWEKVVGVNVTVEDISGSESPTTHRE